MNSALNVLSHIPSNPDTVYLTTASSDGMMVSMIQSNYMGFGSGIVVPGTGISLQTRLLGIGEKSQTAVVRELIRDLLAIVLNWA